MLITQCCPHCGYDLQGLPCPHACPECGEPYDEHTCGWRSPPSPLTLLGLLPLLMILWPVVMERVLGRTIVPAGVKLALGATLVLTIVLVPGIWRRGRRGSVVAITPRGLFVRVRGQGTTIPWNELGAITPWDRRSVVINRLHAFLPIHVHGAFRSESEVADFLKRVATYRELPSTGMRENGR